MLHNILVFLKSSLCLFLIRNTRNTEAFLHLLCEPDNATGSLGKERDMYLFLHAYMENLLPLSRILLQWDIERDILFHKLNFNIHIK